MSAYDLNALSGINASSQGLGVISNNLANSQTVGFKSGRAEFADMFSGAQKSPGNGVRVEAITQMFTQGTITATGREMDLALDGEGFFVLQDQTGKYGNVYTRNGSFKLDKDGYMTDQGGNKVLGYTLNEALAKELNPVFNTTLSTINLMELNRTPRATDEMEFDINLDGQETANLDPFDITQTATVGSSQNLLKLTKPEGFMVGAYGGFPDFSTNKTIHDTLGGEHRLTSNFYKRDVVDAVQGLNAYQDKYNSYHTALVNLQNRVADLAGTVSNDAAYTGGVIGATDYPDLLASINDDAQWGVGVAIDERRASYLETLERFALVVSQTYREFHAEIGDDLDGTANAYDPTAPIDHDLLDPAAWTDANALTDINDYYGTSATTGQIRFQDTYAAYQAEVAHRKDPDNDFYNQQGEKYTSWIVQYTVENYNKVTGQWETSGHRFDQENGVNTNEGGIIYELRFNTDGEVIGVFEPADRTNPRGVNLSDDLETTGDQLPFGPGAWRQVGSDIGGGIKAKLDWVIDTPGTGATDPLGTLDPSTLELAIDVDFSAMTMYSGDYVLRGVTQNGYRIGDLVGLTTSRDGVIEARYSNGRSIAIAQLAVANFNDLNALEKLGGQMYAESFGSGAATIGKAQSGGMGTINAGALEYSNVDTAGELVKMIQTQRTYQASAQVLSTSQELTRTILNL